MSKRLQQKIKTRKARVAVIGLGYVGLPLAVAFARRGFKVLGIDTNTQRVARINHLRSYIADVSNRQIAVLIRQGKFMASTDIGLLQQADVMIICVPTPLKRKYTPDISFMVKAVRSMAGYIRKDTLVVLESTTYPGTTEELIKPELEKSGLRAGRDFYLAFSPERIDPGNRHFKVAQIPKVVGGLTARCTRLTKLLYRQIITSVHEVSSPRAAEMTKLLENSFRIVNIGWINEVAQMCHKLGIDVWEVIEAAKTKPFGFMPFYPGLGVGGHCIPEDPLYLYWKAKRYGFNSKFIKLAADINAHMPHYCLHRLEALLGKPLVDAKILVVGITYKKDVKDLRKSPSIRLVELLKQYQGQVDYYDPLVPYLKIGGIDLQSIRLEAKTVKGYDGLVMAVGHSGIDYALIRRHAKFIFDIKNIYQGVGDPKIVRL
ncbi:MAG: nucleotide sugar dehydrogenase [Candidatus Omnitrophica bacterium]|nr:nucleotide sugar dehydrogenase [Candidatus Omnitrophota bacterium]